MKTVLALLGSPRRLGNSELVAKEIARHLPRDHRLHLLRLPEFRIDACRGCYVCLFKGQCPIADDHAAVVQAVLAADALIVAAPTYFLGPNACLKRFTDRGLALYPHLESLWGKPAVAVGIAGIPGKEGYTLLGLENFLTMLFADIRSRRMLFGALPGELFRDAHNREAARQLAADLMGETTSGEDVPQCPLCGGRTFRFLSRDRVRCMLCSNAGTLDMSAGRTRLKIGKSRHELFLTLEDALAHREWLLSMKTRFKEQKEELKQITSDYRHEGTWIRPAGERRA
jgi:multimeric flavodoxin WrbA